MIKTVYAIFLLRVIFIGVIFGTSISYFNSAAYNPTNLTAALLYNGTCAQCICFAFFSNISPTYAALNCYGNNNTCLLFPSFASLLDVRINTNSKIAFLELPSSASTGNCTSLYGQCGGSGWTGTTNCCNSSSCTYMNTTYAQCLPTSTMPMVLTSTMNFMSTSYINDSRQDGTTGIYWDCCKVSCGWPNKASVTSPARTCKKDGVTTIGNNTQSVCNSGTAYMCTAQQPWNVSDSLSYGYAGASLVGLGESDWCCTCYSLVFVSAPIAGKEMIIQVVNTAYSNNSLFALQIPGGGWSTSSSWCQYQYNTSYSFGSPNGGVTNRSECSSLPSALQSGCFWRFDWFLNATAPLVRFKTVTCPTALTVNTGCTRL